jgi:putative membrane protein
VIRMLVRLLIMLLANAVGLIAAAVLLDGFSINVTSFLIAVLIYTVVFALMLPFLASALRRGGSSALGGVALIATLASLLICDLISSGFHMSGLGTWLAAAVIVWAASLLAAFILPYLGLRKYLAEKSA